MINMLLIGAGGFLGAISRYGVSVLSREHPFGSLPLGTLLVNVIGCLFIGLILETTKSFQSAHHIIFFFVIGFLGSFTTFSTFGFETMELYKKGEISLFFGNIFLNLFFCLLAVQIGIWLSQIIFVRAH